MGFIPTGLYASFNVLVMQGVGKNPIAQIRCLYYDVPVLK
jgi:hypothetical protein